MKTSVVVPTKNNATTIRQCLASLVPYYEQGFINEIVVVDAHSTDGTLDIIRDFTQVKLLFDEGIRPYFAREIGWRQSIGDLLLFMDADTCLGEGFFPKIYDIFHDEQIAMVTPAQKALTSNLTSRTIGEWWAYHNIQMKSLVSDHSSWNILQRLYQKVAWSGEKYATGGGPGYVVRRTTLAAINGFECPEGSADILLSRRIIERGWQSTWWLDAPFYHYPLTSLRRLIKQRHRWGRTDAIMHQDDLKTHHKLMLIISRLGAPVLGVWFAVRYKNPFQILLFPLAQYAWIAGYLSSWLNPKEVVRE
jgi:glycosyltransferase involved in cell wall biosynthesis